MRHPGQLPARTTLLCRRQHISRWPVVAQSTAETHVSSLRDPIGWYVLQPAGPNAEAPWQWSTCLQGVFHRMPAALSALLLLLLLLEDDPDLRRGVKRKQSVLPESIECHEKRVAWLKRGLSPGKFLSHAPVRELKGAKVG